MSHFAGSLEDFYRLRDDRTNRCTDSRVYQNVACSVSLSIDAAETLAGQVMLISATNLLSRWCRKVSLIIPAVAAHPALGLGTTDLRGHVLSQMQDADPFGTFSLDRGRVKTQIALVIGAPDPQMLTASSVFINSAGWLASIGYRNQIDLPITQNGNCLGAIAAACLGVAQVFKLAAGVSEGRFFREGIFNLFSLDWASSDISVADGWPEHVDVGRILMVGAGSVGSAAAYCMRLAGIVGRITIVDKDVVKIENFNRSPIFGRASLGLKKSDAVGDFLKGSVLTAFPFALWWNEFVLQHARSDFDFDVWLPLANDFGVRFSMQNNVPPLMIHASTGANWGINHGRHVPGRDDCLADRFPREASAQDLACATGQVITSEGTIDAALPFSSLFAGLLITADLVRAQLPDYPQVPNFAFLDWYGACETIQAWDRIPRPGCICAQQTRATNEQFNGKTRYWSLSRFN